MADSVLLYAGKVIETRDNLFVIRVGTEEKTVVDKGHDVGLGQTIEVYEDGDYKVIGASAPEPENIPVPTGGPLADPFDLPEPDSKEALARIDHLVLSTLELMVGAMVHMQQVMPQAAGLGPTIATMRSQMMEARMLMKEPEPPVEYVNEPPTIERITKDGEHIEGPGIRMDGLAGSSEPHPARIAADKASDQAANLAAAADAAVAASDAKPGSKPLAKAADKAEAASDKAAAVSDKADAKANAAEAKAARAPEPDHS